MSSGTPENEDVTLIFTSTSDQLELYSPHLVLFYNDFLYHDE
jgi:hypothetical protein